MHIESELAVLKWSVYAAVLITKSAVGLANDVTSAGTSWHFGVVSATWAHLTFLTLQSDRGHKNTITPRA